jgi:hypothetical protein
LAFSQEDADARLAKLDEPEANTLRQELSRLAQADPRAVIFELRRMMDSRFEGIELVHPSWLLAPLAEEPSAVQAAWRAELPPESRGPGPAKGAPRATATVLRALFTRDLAELPPEAPAPKRSRAHLAELPAPVLSSLTEQLRPETLGRALADLGEELAQRVAQRLPRGAGLQVLSGWRAGPSDEARYALLRTARRLGFSLEDAP